MFLDVIMNSRSILCRYIAYKQSVNYVSTYTILFSKMNLQRKKKKTKSMWWSPHGFKFLLLRVSTLMVIFVRRFT